MKSYVGIALFVLLGFLTSIIIGFSDVFSSKRLPYDYEQQGLGKEIVIKFSYVVAENTPKGLAAKMFAHLVNQKTKGRVKVELFPDGSLYNEFDEIDALKQGNVQMIAPSFSIISNQIPEWMVMDLPFAFPNDQAVQAAFHGAIGQELLQTLQSKNMIGMAFWGNGFRQITNDKRPIIQPKDFNGINFRIEQSKVMEDKFRLMHANTTAVPFNQLFQKLESGTVDGEENSISNIYSKKLYQFQNYITICNESYLGYVVLFNQTFWNRIPKDLQNDISEALQETTAWENEEAIQLNQEQWNMLKNIPGLNVHELTPAEKKQWMAVWNPIYDQYKPIFGKQMIEQIRELQRKYGND
ncbi:DctP family TRAP transporter solute-binding subunit [Fodinisporobacter ferrooxydans]|uniref:DctP family TRAP transporter solute-binding subunit n=1 Tax=Fodinisporobacter ferrooxydans TaxID=2901836 RepID=A0ABY4CPY4_9BACL|nr:DctP family TRAP transporter solute-binding subunit [Alicyclobacillaceae bacterium MYW30-H2]